MQRSAPRTGTSVVHRINRLGKFGAAAFVDAAGVNPKQRESPRTVP